MKYKLGDIVTVLGDGLHGTPKYDDNGEYYFLNGNNIENGKLVIKPDTKKVNHEEYLKYRKELNDRTILVSINGTLGKVGTYNNEKCILGKSACYFNIKESVNKEYIKFLLTGKKFQDYIENYATGTTIKNMSLKAMKDFEFELPDRDVQDKVAYILNSITSKIEANMHTNNNLLEIINMKFNEWIDKLTDYELSSLSNIATYTNGLAMQKFRPQNEKGLPVIKIKEMNDGISDNTERCSSHIKDEYIIDNGDILFAWSGTLCMAIWSQGKAGLNQHIFKVNSDTFPKWFYYLWTKKHLDKFIEIAAGKATTMGHIKRKELDLAEVKIPTKEELFKADKIFSPLLDKYIKNKVENETLKNIRDTLLPKLMNGEIDLDKIEI